MKLSSLAIVQFALSLAFFGLFALPQSALAADYVDPIELQGLSSILTLSAEQIPRLPGYGAFKNIDERSILSGSSFLYEARSEIDPWIEEELPLIRVQIKSFASQSAAKSAFDSMAKLNSDKTVSKDDKVLVLESNNGVNFGVFGWLYPDYLSFHRVHLNGNAIVVSSQYRLDGNYIEQNVQQYAESIDDKERVHSILKEVSDSKILALSLLFSPVTSDYSMQSTRFNHLLYNERSLPAHGEINLSFYSGELSNSKGTLLDSSGISDPKAGDLYVYLGEGGELLAGLYAPSAVSDCHLPSGWTRIQSRQNVYPFEWNTLKVSYGTLGFELFLNGQSVARCALGHFGPNRPLFLGDYPDDALDSSFQGYVRDVSLAYSNDRLGRPYDELLFERVFLDLPLHDINNREFHALKEAGVFEGSEGRVQADVLLNRAEMTALLLKAFGRPVREGLSVNFDDVSVDLWYHDVVASADLIGMVNGNDDGLFKPGEAVNRAEFFTMLNRIEAGDFRGITGDFSDVNGDSWYMPAAAFAARNNLLTGSQFSAGANLTRRETAIILYKLFYE